MFRYFAQVNRNSIKATLAYIDIDNFKTINDKFGHEGGDFVLKYFAEILTEQSRKGLDYLFRLGGEEFCVISLDTPISDSYEHMRRIMNTTSTKFKVTKFGEITLSIGIVEFEEKFNSYDEILNLADKKMYEAKKSGKNAIVK